jgi:hypothetical protein
VVCRRPMMMLALMPPALAERFLLQAGKAAAIEIGLPGGKFFL